jgi:hypothetical protein
MDFEQILPLLVASYRKGELVPFIGAGMSRPACVDWEELVLALEREAEIPTEPLAQDQGNQQKRQEKPSPSDLIRRADHAVLTLLTSGDKHFQEACRRAVVNPKHNSTPPPQTEALAKTYWPLVLSTNYDDWYPSLAHVQDNRVRIRILGREPHDCQEVLTSLTTSMGPILWALQGYLGGQANPPYQIKGKKRKELAAQVVVGHHHYQKVINNAQHFRRAFADVFRRRSFLFLGSGLVEDYLINLFSEILQLLSLGSLPHYALLNEEEHKRHGDFLQTRLSVTPIRYCDYKKLPELLISLSEKCSKKSLTSYPSGRIEERYLLCEESDPPASLTLRWGKTLPMPGDGECMAFSAGSRGGRPYIRKGGMGDRALKQYFSRHVKREKPEPTKVPNTSYIYQYGSDPVLSVTARDELTKPKDLRSIAKATQEMLSVASRLHRRTVHLGLLATGKGSKWESDYSLIEMLSGARKAATELGKTCPSLVIYISSRAVWLPLQARKLNVEEILSCPVIKFWAETRPKQGDGLRLLCMRLDDDKLSGVAHLFGFLKGMKNWVVEVDPLPSKAEAARSLDEVWEEELNELGVVNGSTLSFREEQEVLEIK